MREFPEVDAAVAAIARGEMVVVQDSPERENEGDLVMAAEKVTSADVNFMATEGRGLICVPMLPSDLRALEIEPMTTKADDPLGTAFTVSVDLRRGTSTGISASDRAATIRALADPTSAPSDFTRPGHVFPLGYQDGGVLKRAGHTEASIDLAVLAGLRPAAVICEIADGNGEMARGAELTTFAHRHGLAMLYVSDLIAARRRQDPLVRREAEARLPLESAEFRVVVYRDLVHHHEHVALVLGNVGGQDRPLVRVHSECLTGDVFGSLRCDCGDQLQLAIRMIAAAGRGAVVYLRNHEGRGIGLIPKLRAYALQDRGLDTVDANLHLGQPADRRDYGIGMAILADLGIQQLRLLTNNPKKRAGLEGYGLEVLETVPLVGEATAQNMAYLDTKRQRMGHRFPAVPGTTALPTDPTLAKGSSKIMDFEHLQVSERDGALWVGINRPHIRNAFNLQTLDEIITAFRRLDEDPHLGVGVLYGVGPDFSAGGEIQAMMALDQTTGHIWNTRMRQLCMLLRECGKPTIAMVRGWCVGGGNEWQIYCDLAIAAEGARFGQSGARVGALPVVGATQYLPLLMGDRRARRMLFLAEYQDAEQALASGLINEVVPDDELEATTAAWCQKIMSHAPATLRAMKTSLNYLGDLHHPSWIHGSELLNTVWNNEQSDEGMSAFLEKRAPDYSGFVR